MHPLQQGKYVRSHGGGLCIKYKALFAFCMTEKIFRGHRVRCNGRASNRAGIVLADALYLTLQHQGALPTLCMEQTYMATAGHKCRPFTTTG